MTYQWPAVKRAHRREADLAVGKLQHLQRFGELQQLDDVIGEQLFRADRHIHREIFRRKNFRMRQIIGRADARDLGRAIEHGRGELARHHIGFITLRYREHQIRVRQSGLFEYGRMRGVTAHRADVEPVLQRAQALGVGIDDGDVVGFRGQVFGDRRTDLSRAQYNDFQSTFSTIRCDSILCASGTPC